MSPPVRVPTREWSLRAAAGTLGDDWVETSLDPELPPFSQVDGRFHHLPYLRFFPPSLAAAAREAEAAGQPTLHAEVARMLAPVEWWMQCRAWLLTPTSASPQLLVILMEALGLPRSLHRGDPAVLARLAARTERWRTLRGRLDVARELMVQAGVGMPAVDQEPQRASTRREVFLCRSAEWWRVRGGGAARPDLRVRDGLLVCWQPKMAAGLAAEDIWVKREVERSSLETLLRLMPAWVCARLEVEVNE